MLEREREITLRFLAEPTDVNFGGKVHGGAVMKWIDQAGYACAVGWSGQYCVTVYVGGIRFHRPVLIGNMVEVSAKLIYTGKTSMHVAVEVSAGDRRGDKRRFAAIREEGDRLQQAVQDQRGGLLLCCGRHRENLGVVARLARDHRGAQGQGERGGQGESAFSLTIRQLITPIVALSTLGSTPAGKNFLHRGG